MNRLPIGADTATVLDARGFVSSMAATAFCMFDTAIGTCAIAWGSQGIVGASLPESDTAQLRARMAERFCGALEAEASGEIAAAIDGIRAALRGEKSDLSHITLDMHDVPEFNRRVYEIARAIPPGATLTYGDIAKRLGDVSLSRAVGKALGENPFPPIVPCHRILSSDGRMHGFSASGGVSLKLRMLKLEGWDAGQLSLFES
jgi:methylated-DNA-[protein]-cysteine S-methyltransferase